MTGEVVPNSPGTTAEYTPKIRSKYARSTVEVPPKYPELQPSAREVRSKCPRSTVEVPPHRPITSAEVLTAARRACRGAGDGLLANLCVGCLSDTPRLGTGCRSASMLIFRNLGWRRSLERIGVYVFGEKQSTRHETSEPIELEIMTPAPYGVPSPRGNILSTTSGSQASTRTCLGPSLTPMRLPMVSSNATHSHATITCPNPTWRRAA